MGCGASASPALKPEGQEMQTMCVVSATALVRYAAQEMLKDQQFWDNIQVAAPDDGTRKFRDILVSLKQKQETGEVGDVTAEADEAEQPAQGGLMGAIKGVAGAAKGVFDKAQDAAKVTVATPLEAALKKLDGEFTGVAKSLRTSYGEINFVAEVETIFNDVFNDDSFKFDKPHILVRGEVDGNGNVLKPPADTAVTSDYMAKGGAGFKKAFLQLVDKTLDENAMVMTWVGACNSFNSIREVLKKVVPERDLPESVNVNIKKYIVDEVVAKMAERLGAIEAEVRKSPAGKVAKHGKTFELCFTPSSRPRKLDWEAFQEGRDHNEVQAGAAGAGAVEGAAAK